MATDGDRTFGTGAALVVLVGAAMVIVSFRFLDWYDVPARAADTPGSITFNTLHDGASQLSGAGAASAYFGWLAWILLIAGVLVGVAAALPSPVADGLRVVGFLIGLLGVAATYFAIAQYRNAQQAAGAAKHGIFENTTWGVWAALAGFLLTALGAVLGPRRRTR